MKTISRTAAVLLLPLWLAACASMGEENVGITYTDDRGTANQPFPNNYRKELPAFFKVYLNDPTGVRDAAMAEPVQRTVGGRLRYVSCLRYTARDTAGVYGGPQLRAVMYVDGRIDRVVENSEEVCAGLAYLPFPDLEKLTR